MLQRFVKKMNYANFFLIFFQKNICYATYSNKFTNERYCMPDNIF